MLNADNYKQSGAVALPIYLLCVLPESPARRHRTRTYGRACERRPWRKLKQTNFYNLSCACNVRARACYFAGAAGTGGCLGVLAVGMVRFAALSSSVGGLVRHSDTGERVPGQIASRKNDCIERHKSVVFVQSGAFFLCRLRKKTLFCLQFGYTVDCSLRIHFFACVERHNRAT